MLKEIDEITLMSSYKFLKQKEYWVEKLAGEIESIDLAFSPENGSESPSRIEYGDISLSGELCAGLIKMSKQTDASLYILLLAALKTLLYLYTANNDITVISPLYQSNITDETLNRRVFIRDTVSGNMSFKEVALQVRESTLAAYDNQDYPSQQLLEYMHNTGELQDPTHVYNNILCFLENIHRHYPVQEILSRLNVSFFREGESLRGRLIYDGTFYQQSYIQQLARHFVEVLKHITSDVQVKIDDIHILSQQERQQLLEDFNRTRSPLPPFKSIYGMFRRQCYQTPGNTAVLCGSNDMTYGQLYQQVGILAHYLRKKGVSSHTIVPLIAEPSIEMLIGIFAILKAGGCFLPIDPELPPKRIRFMMKDTGAKLCLTHPLPADTLFSGETQAIDTIIRRNTLDPDQAMPEVEGEAGDPLYLIYTSGTTGKPKGVLLTQINLINYCHWFIEIAQLGTEDSTMLTSSFAFDLGYTSLFPSLLSGCRLHIMQKAIYLSAKEFTSYIWEHKVTYLKLTPSLFALLVNSPHFSTETLASLRLVLLGGEAIDLKDVERAHQICSHIRFMNHYGPSEATIGSIARFIDFGRFEEYKQHPTIGRPINNTNAYILGKHRHLLPVGVPGELCISGTCLALGYLNRPQLTAEKFISIHSTYCCQPTVLDNHSTNSILYRTGDLARWLSDGNLEFLGRIDHQVKIRGFRIELDEIRTQLFNHEHVLDALVVVGGTDSDKYICAYIVWNSNLSDPVRRPGHPVSEPDLKEFLSRDLPQYMIPSFFVTMESIPLTPNGKVNRAALPEPGKSNMDRECVPPQNLNEKKLVEIWSEVLNLEKENISINDNFFELGGHSLKVTGLVGRIHKTFNIEIPIPEIFNVPTVKGLAEYMERIGENPFQAVRAVEKRDYYAASSAQQRLFVLQHHEPDSTTYNITGMILLEGNHCKEKFEEGFRTIIRRHDSLRTSFEMVENRLVQRVHPEIEFHFEYYDRNCSHGHGMDTGEAEAVLKNFAHPFQLDKPPLLRLALMEIDSEKHFLMIDIHHIITDGVSVTLMIKEFMTFYAGNELTPVKLQYKDFSQWEADRKEKGLLVGQQKFWLKQFSGKLPLLDLPTDYPRPRVWNFEGSSVQYQLGTKLSAQLKKLALEQGATQYILLLTIFYILLARITRQEDIIVGTPVVGRSHADLENIMGMFVNTLVLRNFPAAEKTFSRFFTEVKENTLQAFNNQDYPFADLVEATAADRDMSRNPLFDVMFDFQAGNRETRGITDEMDIPFLKIKQYKQQNKTSKVDLVLIASESNDRINFELEYNSGLYRKETVQELLRHYEKIAGIIIAQTDIPIKNIELAGEDESNAIRVEILQDIEGIEVDSNLEFDI
jgi:amino acid adenylation domain-containing protein